MRSNGAIFRRVQFWSLPISIIALVIAGYQAWDAHVTTKRALQPLLSFDVENDPERFPFGLIVENDGAGPAIIKSVTYYVDKKLIVGDIESVVSAAKLNARETDFQQFDPGDALGVGQHMTLFSRSARDKANSTEAEKFADFLDARLDIKIEYDSLAGEHFIKCSTPRNCPQ